MAYLKVFFHCLFNLLSEKEHCKCSMVIYRDKKPSKNVHLCSCGYVPANQPGYEGK